MCIYVYIYVHTHINIHIIIYLHVYIFEYIKLYISSYIFKNIWLYILTSYVLRCYASLFQLLACITMLCISIPAATSSTYNICTYIWIMLLNSQSSRKYNGNFFCFIFCFFVILFISMAQICFPSIIVCIYNKVSSYIYLNV